MNKKDKERLYTDFLRGEGYVPNADKEGYVIFKCEGRTYYLTVSEDDDEFFQIQFPNFWPIENEVERAKAEKAAISATAETKVAKVFPIGDNVYAALELFISDPHNIGPIFNRSMSALQVAVSKFVEKMRE